MLLVCVGWGCGLPPGLDAALERWMQRRTAPLTVGQRWTPTGDMATARSVHTATLLLDGKVLVVGGDDSSDYLDSTEVYDPATGLWSPTTNSLANRRASHTATRLSNGEVLVTGGNDSSGYLVNTEVYDPVTNQWRPAPGNLATGRHSHT
ncbi:hypothetical protein Q664_22560, partial [Archangium violaceum Cb vi76]